LAELDAPPPAKSPAIVLIEPNWMLVVFTDFFEAV